MCAAMPVCVATLPLLSTALTVTGVVRPAAAVAGTDICRPEALGTAPGSVTYDAGQVFGGTGYSEDDILSKYFRDAAAWRFLGPENVQAFLNHGRDLARIASVSRR